MGPHKDIYKFQGKITLRDEDKLKEFDIDLEQFLPMGAILCNSATVQALIVYTANETKLALNEGKYTGKISDIAYKLNIFLGINILFVLTFALSMSQIGNRLWNTKN